MHRILRDGLRRPYTFATISALLLFLLPVRTSAQPTVAGLADVRVVNDASGSRLQADGRDFMVFGMNWGYMPIAQNYN